MRQLRVRAAIAGTVVATVALLLTLTTLTVATGAPASAAPALRLTRLADVEGLTAMAARTGTRTLYVAQQGGMILAVRDGKVDSTPVLDLRERVSQDGGERGLLGMTFSPDGTRLYVHYSDTNGDTQVDQYAMRGRRAVAGSRLSILHVEQPQPNHNGGQLAFGPDGYLYLGLGDGGGAGDSGAGHAPGGNGQSLSTPLGKILRIAPDVAKGGYTVPPDNPFVATPDADPAIWSYGLRNPWRFSFDRTTGDLWIGDVGQNAYEEIDHVRATGGRDAGKGVNFGWNRLEGDHAYRGSAPDDADPPVYEIAHDTGACAVVGGYVYRGTKIRGLDGTYFFSDNCDGTIRLLEPDGAGVRMVDSGLDGSAVSSFGQGINGTLYVVSLTNGLSRIDPT
jgi:glucose/arabinose dehydrogenase